MKFSFPTFKVKCRDSIINGDKNRKNSIIINKVYHCRGNGNSTNTLMIYNENKKWISYNSARFLPMESTKSIKVIKYNAYATKDMIYHNCIESEDKRHFFVFISNYWSIIPKQYVKTI